MKKAKIWLAAAAAVFMLCSCGEPLDSPIITDDESSSVPTQTAVQPTTTTPESLPSNIVTENDKIGRAHV